MEITKASSNSGDNLIFITSGTGIPYRNSEFVELYNSDFECNNPIYFFLNKICLIVIHIIQTTKNGFAEMLIKTLAVDMHTTN